MKVSRKEVESYIDNALGYCTTIIALKNKCVEYLSSERHFLTIEGIGNPELVEQRIALLEAVIEELDRLINADGSITIMKKEVSHIREQFLEFNRERSELTRREYDYFNNEVKPMLEGKSDEEVNLAAEIIFDGDAMNPLLSLAIRKIFMTEEGYKEWEEKRNPLI